MKTTLSIICVTLLAILFVGCASTSNQQAQTEQLLVTTGAAAGTITDLQSHPQDAPYFIAGEQILNTLGGSTNQLSAAAVDAALAAAGDTNTTERLIAPLVVNVINAYGGNATNGLSNAQIQSICLWAATGIGEGLGSAK